MVVYFPIFFLFLFFFLHLFVFSIENFKSYFKSWTLERMPCMAKHIYSIELVNS